MNAAPPDASSPAPSASTGVTVIGLGAIGSAIARTLLRAGRPVTVYNRTSGRDEDLVSQGARRAASLTEAIAAEPLVMACLTDHDAAHQLFADTFSTTAWQGRRLVLFATSTPEEADLMARTVSRAGGSYLDAGVQTAPGDVGSERAQFIYSGSDEVSEHGRDALGALGEPPTSAMTRAQHPPGTCVCSVSGTTPRSDSCAPSSSPQASA